MTVEFFLQGLLIGFVVAVPVGPVGVFCFKRFLVDGIVAGLASGFGIATADALAASVALLGLTLVANFLASHQRILRLIAGIVLCYIGTRTVFRRPAVQSSSVAANGGKGLVGSYFTVFFLTFANPVTNCLVPGGFYRVRPERRVAWQRRDDFPDRGSVFGIGPLVAFLGRGSAHVSCKAKFARDLVV